MLLYNRKAVMHFAAYAYVGESVENPDKYYRNNVAGTLTLLEAMKDCGVDKIIFSSTCATYGMSEKIPIPEEHIQNPINPYGRSKLMVEWILKDFSTTFDMKYVSLSYFNAAGADPDAEIGEDHEPETHLIPLILDVARGRRDHLKIFGTDYDTPVWTCIRDYIHVTDLANAHLLSFVYLLGGGKSDVFNLVNGDGFSVIEVIAVADKITQKKIPVIKGERRSGDLPILIGSAQKAMKTLNWQPVYFSLDDIIGSAWDWHKKKHETCILAF